MFTKDAMKARYLELGKQRTAIRAKADPLRAEMDALVAEHQPKERALSEAIKKASAGLYDVEQEMSLIAKALGSGTPAIPE